MYTRKLFRNFYINICFHFETSLIVSSFLCVVLCFFLIFAHPHLSSDTVHNTPESTSNTLTRFAHSQVFFFDLFFIKFYLNFMFISKSSSLLFQSSLITELTVLIWFGSQNLNQNDKLMICFNVYISNSAKFRLFRITRNVHANTITITLKFINKMCINKANSMPIRLAYVNKSIVKRKRFRSYSN